MKKIETKRLILRKFDYDDLKDVCSYANCAENTIYMPWGPNTEDDTREFISMTICEAEKTPCKNYHYAAVLKSSGKLIGGCSLMIYDCGTEAEIGWILHRNYWKNGYASEIGMALLEFSFDELGINRIIAHCDEENQASYKVMEKIGMRREGLFIEGRLANKLSDKKYGNELSYAILKREWEVKKEIDYYNKLTFKFDEFIDVPVLSSMNKNNSSNYEKSKKTDFLSSDFELSKDGIITSDEIYLVCTSKKPAVPEKGWVPSYEFIICLNGEKIGDINLRVGYTDGIYYAGNIGYSVHEKYRGKNYAKMACELLIPVMKAHSMKKVIITNEKNNNSSKRVCEKLNAKLIRTAEIPSWHDLYKEGQRYVNIFEWSI